MKRTCIILFLALLSTAGAASAQIGQFVQQNAVWDGPIEIDNLTRSRTRNPGEVTDAQMRQLILQTLQTPHDNAINGWREGVEERLVSFGPQALPLLRSEMSAREGYEFDVLLIASFRIDNSPLDPRQALVAWGEKRFAPIPPPGNPNSPGAAPLRATHILDMTAGAGGGSVDIFPHHLFYVVECLPKRIRSVVALAADGKIQPLDDDASLFKFMRTEAPPQRSQVGRERLGAIAALLSAARTTSIYKPENLQVESQNFTVKAAFDAPEFHQTAAAAFDSAGALQTLATAREKTAAPVVAPVLVPTTLTAPPPPPPIAW